MVFCASLAPCPKEMAAAETSWSPLKAGCSSWSRKTRWIPKTRYMAAAAITKATSGEATMPTAALVTLPHEIAARPPAAMPAPTRPPMTAWLEDEGMPRYQVT